MTKVNAFKIEIVDSWMSTEFPAECNRGFVKGYGYREHMNVRDDIMELFKPEPGHYCIVWPHGLVTFRPPESFERDFKHIGGTVYETPYIGLFQKDISNPAYIAPDRVGVDRGLKHPRALPLMKAGFLDPEF